MASAVRKAIGDMPDELLLHTFHQLDLVDLCRCKGYVSLSLTDAASM